MIDEYSQTASRAAKMLPSGRHRLPRNFAEI